MYVYQMNSVLLLDCNKKYVVVGENGDVTETSLLSTGITKMTSHVDSCGSRSVIAVIDKDHIAVTGEKQHQQGGEISIPCKQAIVVCYCNFPER